MSRDFQAREPSRRWKGIVIVLAVHAVIGWALISGTARSGLNLLKKPLEAVVIQEVIIPPPPPPPPPPPKEIKQPDIKVDAPPPPFVPPPDVAPLVTTTAPTIVATTVAPPPAPAPTVIAPPATPVQTGPTRSDIRLACPTQVQPEMPRRALQDGTEGIVKAQVRIKDGVVKEVSILSGPVVFHAAVRAALLQYKCVSGLGEVIATQEFAFKIE